MDKFQLHVSGLLMLSKCGEQFRRRYIEGEKAPPGVSAVVGTAVDRSVTANLGNKIEKGELLPADTVEDVARDTLVTEWEKGVALTPDERDDGLTDSKADAIDKSVSLAFLHHQMVAPRITPTHLQRAWVLDIAELPVQLAGTIDIQEGAESIRDTKTSAKSPKADAADKSLQLTTYALAVRQIDGQIPARLILDYCVQTPKRKDTKYVQLETKRTVEQIKPLLARISQATEAMQRGSFAPAPPDSWQCSEKWCGFFQTCLYALHPISILTSGPKAA